MRRLLLPLIAALAVPTAAMANEAWLVLSYGNKGNWKYQSDMVAITTVPMKTMKGCEEEGAKWAASKSTFNHGQREYKCLQNK